MATLEFQVGHAGLVIATSFKNMAPTLTVKTVSAAKATKSNRSRLTAGYLCTRDDVPLNIQVASPGERS